MNANFLRGVGNHGIELTRLIGASAAILYPLTYIWSVLVNHNAPPSPSDFGIGYAAVLAAIGAMIGVKDVAVAKAAATAAETTP